MAQICLRKYLGYQDLTITEPIPPKLYTIKKDVVRRADTVRGQFDFLIMAYCG